MSTYAMRSPLEYIADLELAVSQIVAAWESGDLAGAVNDAASLVKEANE